MSRLCRFFAIIITACTAVGCFSPIGSIGGSVSPDRFRAEPVRDKYKVGDSFDPDKDIKLWISYQGAKEVSVPVQDADIGIADDPDEPDDLSYDYLFSTTGKKLVVAEYEGMTDSYSIEVLDTDPEKGDDAGIIIKWEGDE